MFVGHESEVPNVGDYRTGLLGQQPILITRGKDMQVRVMLNRCTHRGNTICQARRGNAQTFTCSYHGWTYSCEGDLKGILFREDYPADFRREDHGLFRVPRVEQYRGFIFASMGKTGKSLQEHLGPAAANIDRFCDLSPTGEITMNHGVYQMRIECNWKMWMENSVDSYHVYQTHGSNMYLGNMFEAKEGQKPPPPGKGYFGLIHARDLGNGHSDLDMRPQRRVTGMTYTGEWSNEIPESAQREYLAGLERLHGKDKANQILTEGPAHTVIFPNLFNMLQEIRWCVPVSVNETYIYYAPCLFKGAPDADQHRPPAPRRGRLRPGRLPAGRRHRGLGAQLPGPGGARPGMDSDEPRPAPAGDAGRGRHPLPGRSERADHALAVAPLP